MTIKNLSDADLNSAINKARNEGRTTDLRALQAERIERRGPLSPETEAAIQRSAKRMAAEVLDKINRKR